MGRELKIMLLVSIFVFGGCYSCKSFHSFWGSDPVPGEVVKKFFWDPECLPIVAAAPAPKPKPVVGGTCGPYSAMRDYPCGVCGSLYEAFERAEVRRLI